jgi:peroxiredoxin Q/BCP
MASTDDADTNRRFAADNGADFPVLSDPDQAVARAYGVLGAGGHAQRWTFYIGGDGRILDIDKSVNARNAGADLAARLAALGVPRR